ncbi:MAG: hypothetical protein H0W18_14880 [Acidobacteria bacterium]|nr:hypothetical protein [Acidobacteriota bacterium]
MSARCLSALAVCCLLTPLAAFAQESQAPETASRSDPQIELNLIALPTTQSISRHRGYFRLTHRFARDLRLGDFSDLANDFFALDNGAVIGFEYRFAVEENIHVGIHRSTLNKALQLFSRWDAVRQGQRLPVGLSGFATIEALDNLQDGHQPGAGAVVSRTWGQALALYASPTYVYGTFDAERIASGMVGHDHGHKLTGRHDAHEAEEHASHKSTFYVGLGGRLRVRPTVFLVGEFTPRVSGHDPGDAMWGVALEKWTRGHTLQLNLTNSFATTPGQIARGGTPDAIYLGFNITRKF